MGLIVLFAAGFALIALAAGYGIARSVQRPPRKTYGVAIGRGLPTDPAHLSPDFTELQHRFRDGTSTTVWDIPGGSADGPAVVFVHGHADSRFGALTWAPFFHDMVSRVILYDLRAHGDSTAQAMRGAMGEADELLELIDALLPGTPVILFGASMGAGIALVAAAKDNTGQVAGVVADSVYRHLMEPVRSTIRLRGYPSQPYVWVAHQIMRLAGHAPEPFDRAHHAAQVTCPLLVIHGRDDRVIAHESAEAVADAAPDARFELFDEAGHVSSGPRHPQRYRELLAEFFSEVLARHREARAHADAQPPRIE